MKKSHTGVTLLELAVSSSLMGLLFFSGLQLLSAVFSVQSALFNPERQTFSMEKVYLEAKLRGLLQDASQVDIADNGHTLHYRDKLKEPLQTLRFQYNPQCDRWQLLQGESKQEANELAHWKNKEASSQNRFQFRQEQDKLLSVVLDKPKVSLEIWLRNQP